MPGFIQHTVKGMFHHDGKMGALGADSVGHIASTVNDLDGCFAFSAKQQIFPV